MPFDYLDAALLQHAHHGLPGDPIEETIGRRCVHFSVFDKEQIGASGLSHITAIIQHHCIRTAFGFGGMFRHGADHIKPSGLGKAWDCFGTWALPFGDIELCAVEFGIPIIGAPFPSGHCHAHGVIRRGDSHIFTRTAPANRPYIGILKARGGQDFLFRRFNIVHGIWNWNVHIFARFQKPFGMFTRFENLSVIGALTFKHRAAVMQAMGQDVNLSLAPVYQFAIHPDDTVTVVICASHV